MNQEILDIINDTVESYRSDIEKSMTEEDIEEIKREVNKKVLIKVKEDLKIDTYNNPDKGLLNDIAKEVSERIDSIKKEQQQSQSSSEEIVESEKTDDIDIDNMSIADVLVSLEEEAKEIRTEDEKDHRRKATANNGRLIKKIKKEIKKIKEAEEADAKDLEALEKLEEMLDEQLEWHKNQLTSRYKYEFRKKPASFAAIITVLPKGVKLQAQRVVNCIRQLKEAKTNKERIFKVLELGKQIGLLAATPVIFTVKFIVKHWYLLLLLLLLLRLPGFNWKPGKEKNPSNDYEPEYQAEPVHEMAPSALKDQEQESIRVNNPVTKTALETDSQIMQDLSFESQRAEQQMIREMNREAAKNTSVSTAVDTSTNIAGEKVVETTPEMARDLSLESQRAEQQMIREMNREAAHSTSTETIGSGASESIAFEQNTESYSLFSEMLKRVNERSNGHIYIRELAQNPDMGWDADPNLIVCNEPGEYIRKLGELYGINISKCFDEAGRVTASGYELILERHMIPVGNDSRFVDIIYQDPAGQYISDFKSALPNSAHEIENIYENIKTINCFDTVQEFTDAVTGTDPKYEFLRESITYFLEVSETQEAINCLKNLGIIIGAGAIPSVAAGAASTVETAITAAPAAIEAFLKLIELSPEEAQAIYEFLSGLKFARQLTPFK